MHQLVSQPIHLNNEGKPSSLFDLIFTNTPHLFSSSAEVMAPLTTSDHLPVGIECSIARRSFHPVVGGEYTKWHYELKDVGKMEDAFLYDSWEYVFQPYDINETWNRWKSAFFNDIESFLPKSTQKSKKNHLSSPWFSKKLRCLIRRKNQPFKRALASGNPDYWRTYCSARNKTTTAINRAKRAHFQKQASILADPNCTPSKWWRVARDLCGLKGSASTCLPPLLVAR